MGNQKQNPKNDERVLLTFLKRTKEGEYASVGQDTIVCEEVESSSEDWSYEDEEAYYYSTR